MRLPADFNPNLVLHSCEKTATIARELSFDAWILDRQQPDLTVYKTFYGVITETIPELEHSRIQWVAVLVVVVVFSDFLF